MLSVLAQYVTIHRNVSAGTQVTAVMVNSSLDQARKRWRDSRRKGSKTKRHQKTPITFV